ncbi:PRC-barrel domain-containing protein [Paraburkholderia kururiensis]|uniref:PRC-barrel domain-containing protein n=1 Tax=Paraburkholderia kururiensis TaxID=984307 RepID=UPI0005A65982|nr:PRC-barrel domain-containing protein [Paraburkholderia kururiensis]
MTPGSPIYEPSSDGSDAQIIGLATSSGGPGPGVMAADTLIGDKVLSSDGKGIGKIEDIMLDVRSGRIEYAVLSCGGFLGMGDKLLAVPWGALTLDTDEKCFRLGATEERIKSASGFDKDHWPAMADSQWGHVAHQYAPPL